MRTEYEINQIVARIQAQINKNLEKKDNAEKVFVYNLNDFKDNKGK